MFVKFLFEDLNPDPYISPPTSTYTCGMTGVTTACGEKKKKKT